MVQSLSADKDSSFGAAGDCHVSANEKQNNSKETSKTDRHPQASGDSGISSLEQGFKEGGNPRYLSIEDMDQIKSGKCCNTAKCKKLTQRSTASAVETPLAQFYTPCVNTPPCTADFNR